MTKFIEDLAEKVRPLLVKMQVNETLIFPICRLKTVRTQASELGAIYDRAYSTKTDRVAKTIEVTRTA